MNAQDAAARELENAAFHTWVVLGDVPLERLGEDLVQCYHLLGDALTAYRKAHPLVRHDETQP